MICDRAALAQPEVQRKLTHLLALAPRVHWKVPLEDHCAEAVSGIQWALKVATLRNKAPIRKPYVSPGTSLLLAQRQQARREIAWAQTVRKGRVLGVAWCKSEAADDELRNMSPDHAHALKQGTKAVNVLKASRNAVQKQVRHNKK